MPIINVQGVGKVRFPDNMSDEDIVNAIETNIIPKQKEHETKTGFIPATKAGFFGSLGAAEQALGSVTGSDTLTQWAKENAAKAQKTFEPTTAEDIAAAQGFFPTLGKQLSQKVTEPLGGIVGGYGVPIAAGVAAGALAPGAAVGAGATAAEVAAAAAATAARKRLIGGLAGTAVAQPSEMGYNIEAQQQANPEQAVNLVNAALASIPQSLLVGFGMPGTKYINKIGPALVPEAQALIPKVLSGQLTKEEATAALTNRATTFLQSMATNTVAGTGMMVGTEELRRLQAGTPFMSADELGHTLQTAATLSPIFAAMHPSGRRAAEAQIETAGKSYAQVRDAKIQAAMAERQRQADMAEQARATAQFEEAQLRRPFTSQDLLPLSSSVEQAAQLREQYNPQQDLFMAPNEAPPRAPEVQPDYRRQDELELTPVTSIEDVAQRRADQDTQGDLFTAPRPVEVAPPAEVKPFEPRPVQDQVNLVTGVDRISKGSSKKEIEEAANKPSGVFVNDPATQMERELTVAELEDIRVPRDEAAVSPLKLDVPTLTSLLPKMTDKAPIVKSWAGKTLDTPEKFAAFNADIAKIGEKYPVNEVKFKEIEDAYIQANPQGRAPESNIVESRPEAVRADIPAVRDTGGRAVDTGGLARNELPGMDVAQPDVRQSPVGARAEYAAVSPREAAIAEKARLAEQARAEEKAANLAAAKAEQVGIAADQLEATKRVAIDKAAEAKQAEADLLAEKTTEELPTIDERQFEPDVEEARGAGRATGQTAETVKQRLQGEFGKAGIDSMEKRGLLTVVDSAKDLPANIRSAIDATSIAAHSEGKAYLIADRMAPENVRQALLHEIGEHYGLKGMVGEKAYDNILKQVDRLKTIDPVVRDATAHVERMYPELKNDAARFNREILARVGETAPQHSLYRKLVAAVKNFLVKYGFKSKLTTADLHDLVQHSLHTAMKRDIEAPVRGVEAAKFPGEWAAVSKKRMESLLSEGIYHGDKNDHRTRSWIAQVDPRKFVEATTTSAKDIKDIEKEAGRLNLTKLREEGQTPFIYIDNGEVTGHEGRHRMMALAKAGVTRVPVVVRQRGEASNKYRQDFMELKGQEFYGIGRGKPLTVYNAIPLNMAERNTARQEYTKTNELRTLEFAKKAVQEPNEELNRLYKEAGAKDKVEEPTTSLFNSYKDDPEKFVAEKKKGLTHFLDNIQTQYFSSDAGLNNAIRRSIQSTGASWETIKKLMHEVSTSQALHAEGVAHRFLETGGLKYNPELMKFEAFENPNGSWKGTIDAVKAAAEAKGIPYAEMEQYAHKALEARRLALDVVPYNERLTNRLATQVADKKMTVSEANKEWEANRKEVHMTTEQIAAGMKFFDKIPELNEVVKQWDNTRKSVIDFAVETGLYTEEKADMLWDSLAYVPFFRVEQLEDNAGPKDFSRGLLDAATDKRFKGSHQEVNNIFDNMERWTSYMVRKGVNNKSAQNLTKAALEYLPGEVRQVENVAQGMRENTFSIWENGRKQLYEFKDPMFVHAFTGMESVAIPALKGAAWFTNALRQNIVLNPLFSVGQLSQDAFGAMLSSGLKHPFALPLEVMREFGKTLKGTSAAHMELKNLAGAGVRDYSAIASRVDAEIAAGLKAPTKMQRFLAPLQKLSMASDNAVRQAIYNRTLIESGGKKMADGRIVGGDKATAVERAFEIINFRRGGASKNVALLRRTVPFFGAYLQSLNVTAKVLSGRGISPSERTEAYRVLGSNLAKVMALGFIYNTLVSEDEGYKKLDPTVRDRHLVIPGTDGVMIPLRSDVFTLISKIIPEHLYQMTLAEETEDGTKAGKAIGTALANALLSPNALPQVIKPAVEVGLNRNLFTGQPIVGQGQERLETNLQFGPNTSQLARVIGMTGLISPLNVDYLLKSYFGYTGGLALMATDDLIAQGTGAVIPDKSLRDQIASIPGMSTFVSKEFGTKDMNDFYELKELTNKATASLNKIKEIGTPEEQQAYREKNLALLQADKQVNRIGENIAKLSKRERLITESKTISAADKETQLREIRTRKIQMAKRASELRKSAGL